MLFKKIIKYLRTYEAKVTVILTIAVLLPLLLFAALSLRSASNAFTKIIANGLEEKSVLVAHDINSFISERIIDARVLSQADVLESDNVSNTIQYLTEIVDANKWINDIDVLDAEGNVRASSGEQNESGQNIVDLYPGSKSIYRFLPSAKQGDVFVSEVLSLDTGQGLLFMTPITDDTNTLVIGGLSLEVNLDNISRIVSLFDEGIIGKKHVYIVDNDGRVIVSANPALKVFSPFPDLSVQPGLLEAFAHQGKVGNIIYFDNAGDEVMAAYADMEEFGVNKALDWSIIAIAPVDEITLAATEVKSLLLGLGVVIAFVTMFFVFFYISKLQSNLKGIAIAAEAISHGDYSKRLMQSGQSGALGLLTNAFNHMTQTVESSIRELGHREEMISRQAYYDDLTDLPNRFLILNSLSQLLKEADHEKGLVAVMFLDVDNFKKVNDSLGHEYGDKVIVEISNRLKNMVREGDLVGRLGGDEFVVLLKGLKNTVDAKVIADNILFRINDSFKINNKELIMTASIGISMFPDNGTEPAVLLRHADSAMYHAKYLGRNTSSFFTEQLNHDITRRIAVEEQMRGALERNEFEVHYQPKVDISSGKIIGAEALLRWKNSALGSIFPDEFIPVAEHTGLIIPIGQFVLNEAFEATKQWNSNFDESFAVAVNLSPRQFKDPGLVISIKESMDRIKISPNCVEMEITEGILMGEHSYINNALAELDALGIKISMDDFGTGYSSLSYLRKYPFDILKIDRSFISDITVDSTYKELTKAAIAMAHSLNLKVVAEGIETTEQLNLLKEMNCEYGQGYLFSKPVPKDKMTAILADSDVNGQKELYQTSSVESSTNP